MLVGENNSGKSNVVDAIRLVTTPSDGRRTRYCESTDISFDTDDRFFAIRAVYEDLSPQKQALFLSANNGVGTNAVSYRLRHDLPDPDERRGRNSWTVGGNDSSDQEPAARERIRHVFLPPLRDAQQALASGSGDRIEFVLRALAEDGEIDVFEESAANAFDGLGADPLLVRTSDRVSDRLTDLSRGAMPHTSKFGFADPTLRQLARAMRLKIGEVGLDPGDLAHTGLGYANLLFLATVVVELEATRDADLTIFLVEEPEAHLHPQLQTAVLDFLTKASRHDDEVPGEIQVIVTTHSAQLASAVPSAHVAAIKAPQVADSDPPARCSAEVPVWKLPVPEAQLRKVDRYINATRSPMLFGPRVLLVEGLAEALLLPPLARLTLDQTGFARFRGVALVAIDGVDFEPYVRLLLSRHEDISIAERVVVITDKDPGAPGDRVTQLTDLAAELGAQGQLQIEAADITLEASIFSAGNEAHLRTGFLAQRPQSQEAWDEMMATPEEGRAAAMLKLLTDKRIAKGDLAQHLAGAIEAQEPFTVPPYLHAAISAVVA